MKRIYALFLIVGIVSSTLWSQENLQQQLYQSFLLEQKGQFDKAIQSLLSLIASKKLTQAECGRSWTLLGFAYQERGEFQQAQEAYERSLRIFAGDTEHIADYANSLEYSARLYAAMGQEQMAMKMGSKAAEIDVQRNDHSGLARIYTNFAKVAIQEHHRKAARQFLEKATAESHLSNEMTDDENAALFATQAWFASTNGNAGEAVAGYTHALELWKRSHGEQHALTGWGYVLLGQAWSTKGQTQDALMDLRQGLAILQETVGPQNPKYLVAEILYSKLLEQNGMRVEGSEMRAEAEKELRSLLQQQCIDCTVSLTSLLQK